MYDLSSATLEITRKCNAKCIHCIVDAGAPKNNELTNQEIIKFLEDIADLGASSVVLTGGDPFMRKEWPMFLHKASTLGLQVIFMTNALAINDEVIEVLKGFDSIAVGISLDGPDAQTHDYVRGVKGIFDHFVEVVPKLIEAGIYVAVPTTVMQSNFDRLDEIRDLLIDLKVPSWQLQIVKPSTRLMEKELLTEKQYYELAQKIVDYRKNYSDKILIMEADCIGYNSILTKDLYIKTWHGCECGIYSVSIESDGNVKGCPNMVNSEGNIKERPFKEIWADHNSFKYNRCPDLSALKGYCAECSHRFICRGGCPTNPLTRSGQTFCLHKIEKCGCDEG